MFAKVFTQILDSSLAEDYQIRHVFEDLLKLCDVNGVVDMTHEAISRRTNVPLEIVKRGIEVLEKPDTRSRNPEFQGRRIIRLDEHRDWGWMICNYKHYRDIASDEQRREKTLIRVKRHREKNKGETHGNAGVTVCNASVTPANAINAMQKQRQMYSEEREKALPEVPPISRKDFDALAATRGIPKDCADWFWNTHDARNWVDATGQPIIKVEPLLLNALVKWRSQKRSRPGIPEPNQTQEILEIPRL